MTPPTPPTPPAPAPTVACALGSGGARGYAHIGVVQALQDRGYDITGVAGSSMGALVGGLHCADKLDDFAAWAIGLGQFEVLRLMDVSLSAGGAVRGERVFRIVGELLGDVAIEDLPVDFTAVAVDLLAGREVWFREGPLDLAVRASSAIPSFVVPVTHNGRVLVDGGLLNPIPVAPIAASGADLVVAVSLQGQSTKASQPVTDTALDLDESEWAPRLKDAAAKWFDSDMLRAVRKRLRPDFEDTVRARLTVDDESRSKRKDKTSIDDDLGAFDVMQASIDAMQAALARHALASYAPDILISVPKNAARTLDFHRASELIAIGRDLTNEALDQHETAR